jgi:hypothetical protein
LFISQLLQLNFFVSQMTDSDINEFFFLKKNVLVHF